MFFLKEMLISIINLIQKYLTRRHNKDIDRIKINPISSVDVVPNVIHRVESISDILLYETSTPHLNDVIRIADDSKRASGRIETEHQSQ